MTDNHHDRGDDFEFSKELDIDVDIDIEWDIDVDVNVYKDVDITVDICQDIDLDGNYAELNLDAQALGDDTLVEVDASVLTTDDMSSIVLHVVSAVD